MFWFKETPISGQPLPTREVWRTTRVAFGTMPSTFLLTATLKHHFGTVKEWYSKTAKGLNESVYANNLFTGGETKKEVLEVYHETKDIFQQAFMNLRKVVSSLSVLNMLLQESEEGKLFGTLTDVPKVLVCHEILRMIHSHFQRTALLTS